MVYTYLDEECIENKVFYPNESAAQTCESLTMCKDKELISDKEVGFWEIKVSIMQSINKIWDKLVEYLKTKDYIAGISTYPIYGTGDQFYKIKIINKNADDKEIIKKILEDLETDKLVHKNEKLFYYTLEDYQANENRQNRHFKFCSTYFKEKPAEEN